MLQIDIQTGAEATVCVLAGNLDIATCGEAAERLSGLQKAGAPAGLLLDIAGVQFLSSVGLGTLLDAAKRSRSVGVGFALCCPAPRVRRILEIAGFDLLMPILPDRASGLRAVSGRGDA
jgi:anti-sigma B factor antagonist